jgi:FdhD protein
LADGLSRSHTVKVLRFTGEGRSAASLSVIREVPLTVFYNDKEIITLLTTPDHFPELAVGFLKSEGFLDNPEDLIQLALDEEEGTVHIQGRTDSAMVEKLMEKRTITSGCGKGTTFYHALDALQIRSPREGFRITLDRLMSLVKEINETAMKRRVAGGVHHAALAGGDGAMIIMEDIGRHNAIDKINGHCFLSGMDTRDKFLMSTGRISSEILIKGGKMGVPLIVSLSKPTDLALELAERLRISVVGNLRGSRGIIYKDFGRLA